MDTKKRFEVKYHLDRMTGRMKKDIFIDDKLFEYEVDPNAMKVAQEMGPMHANAIGIELQKHFLNCLSEELGREITNQEVTEAIMSGWI